MIQSKSWHKQAIELRGYGFGSRRIATTLGVGKSTVNDFFKKYDEYPQPNKLTQSVMDATDCGKNLTRFQSSDELFESLSLLNKGPRIFIYDIETAPILAHVWKLWDNNVGLNQIQSDWYMMSFCGKWLGEDEIFYYDQRDAVNMEDDSYILSKLWSFLNEADIVVGQNVKRFDTKKVNARFILNGFPKPSTYRQIDTMVIAKEQFGFTSNKLEYMSKRLCPDHVKDGHKDFPGHEMWVECMAGNQMAWQAMENYNRDDVLATEELYNVLSSWDSKLPNFDVYVDEVLDMSEWVEDGYHYTNLAKYKRYRNIKTGVQRRSRVNELSKEKRQSLLANI